MVVWAGCSDLVRDALGLWLQSGGASPLQLLFSRGVRDQQLKLRH